MTPGQIVLLVVVVALIAGFAGYALRRPPVPEQKKFGRTEAWTAMGHLNSLTAPERSKAAPLIPAIVAAALNCPVTLGEEVLDYTTGLATDNTQRRVEISANEDEIARLTKAKQTLQAKIEAAESEAAAERQLAALFRVLATG